MNNKIAVAGENQVDTSQSSDDTNGCLHQPASVALRHIIMHPTGAIVELVDDLLAACLDQNLELDWQIDRCRFQSFGGDWEELAPLPLRKSVFRAILARVAILCNERTPNSVSPYGGKGELSVAGKPDAVIRVAFINTTAKQHLEMAVKSQPVPRTVDALLNAVRK